jgi:hypothetical protein
MELPGFKPLVDKELWGIRGSIHQSPFEQLSGTSELGPYQNQHESDFFRSL